MTVGGIIVDVLIELVTWGALVAGEVGDGETIILLGVL
jgi:hypothetical protein